MRIVVLLLALLVSALPGEAPAFTPPAGCEGVVTIQHRGCRVVHLWRCEADPEGIQHLALFGPEGAIRLRTVDAEYQWLETTYVQTGRTEWMRPLPVDAPSITDLLAAGTDTYEFIVDNSDGFPILNRGEDRLSGGSIMLNGYELVRTSYTNEYFSLDGTSLGISRGDQFVIPELRIFVWGVFYDNPNPGDVADFTPMEMIRPGEPGFFADEPKFGCGDLLSRSGVVHDGALTPLETGFSE